MVSWAQLHLELLVPFYFESRRDYRVERIFALIYHCSGDITCVLSPIYGFELNNQEAGESRKSFFLILKELTQVLPGHSVLDGSLLSLQNTKFAIDCSCCVVSCTDSRFNWPSSCSSNN